MNVQRRIRVAASIAILVLSNAIAAPAPERLAPDAQPSGDAAPAGKRAKANAHVSLVLAREFLTQVEIRSPRSNDLRIVLLGGDLALPDGRTVPLLGILRLRAQGWSWLRIANLHGIGLEQVLTAAEAANESAW